MTPWMILALPIALYVVLALMFRQALPPLPSDPIDHFPRVSIIVACRNEQDNLPDLLESLQRIDYPSGQLEIILIDDASTDATARLIREFAENRPQVTAISLKKNEKEKAGKAGALIAGIDQSSGEFIFITDADCRVSPDWVRSLLPAFKDDIGCVGGCTLIEPAQTLFAKVQQLDWNLLLTIAAGASQRSRPITWVGNNLAIRRRAYDEIGGYRGLPDSFVEDFALVDALSRTTGWRCRFYIHGPAVLTQAQSSLREWYSQRRRWAFGITHARPFGMLVMSTALLSHVTIIALLFTSPLHALFALSLKLVADLILLHPSKRDQRSIQLLAVLCFQIYYFFYTVLLPIALLFDRRVQWKGETFTHH